MNVDGMSVFGISLTGMTGLGLVTGYAAKKIAKLVALLLGLEVSLLAALEYEGVLSIDWGALSAWLTPSEDISATVMQMAVSTGLLGGGFGLGFAVGFKKA